MDIKEQNINGEEIISNLDFLLEKGRYESRREFTNEKLAFMRDYNYLNKNNAYSYTKKISSVLRIGNHSAKTPFVTIIVPTYQRPHLLKETLYSILNQKGFNDYEIIIIDNEGIQDNLGVSPTEQLIQNIDSKKIIYYRNEKNIFHYSWNKGIMLAKSKWLCMVHDDDILDENHLRIMCNILKNNPQINFLGCKHYPFKDNAEIKQKSSEQKDVRYCDFKNFMYDFSVLYLGALFKREMAIEMGGFDSNVSLPNMDYIFVSKYSYFYKTYICYNQLYNYRVSSNQASSNSIVLKKCIISDYFLMKAIAKKRFILLRPIFYSIVKYNIIKKIEHSEYLSLMLQKNEFRSSEILKQCYCKNTKINKLFRNILQFISNTDIGIRERILPVFGCHRVKF